MTGCRSTSEAGRPEAELAPLLDGLRACRVCRDRPRYGPALPHEPRPIVQLSASARIAIASQAPGNRAHQSGIPFQDPSGVRLRHWLGLDETAFYDASRLAILPMGACFPGYDRHGGDLPPRRECAELWRAPFLRALPRLDLILLVGAHAQRFHLGATARSLSATVEDWRAILAEERRPRLLPLPHPSWRNTAWLRRHPWFEADLLPILRAEVSALMG